MILPRKAVLELGQAAGRQRGYGDDRDFREPGERFPSAASVLTTKIVDGKFPDYKRVVPTDYQRRFSIKRSDLQQALQRAAILSNEKFRGVRWVIGTNSLHISCTNNEQEEAEEELEVNYGGEALDVGFNVSYLLDVLDNVHSDRSNARSGMPTAAC